MHTKSGISAKKLVQITHPPMTPVREDIQRQSGPDNLWTDLNSKDCSISGEFSALWGHLQKWLIQFLIPLTHWVRTFKHFLY